MTKLVSMINFSENDDPYIDEDGNFLANEQIVSDTDDDLALDDEEYHEALLGYREARDLTKKARVAGAFYPVVVPIRSEKATGRGKGGFFERLKCEWPDWSWQGWKRIEIFWKTFRTLVARGRKEER